MDSYDHSKPYSVDTMDPSQLNYSADMGLSEYIHFPHESPMQYADMSLPPVASSEPMDFQTLNMSNYDTNYASSATYSPARPITPLDGASISPHALAYPPSAGELSSDGMTSGRRSRGSGSPAPYSTAQRAAHRYTPMGNPATRPRVRAQRKGSLKSNDDRDSDEDDDDFQPIGPAIGGVDSKRETIRRQRIESEQRRRDELREGYARLKDTLPRTPQKSSKVVLLDRAVCRIKHLEVENASLHEKAMDVQRELQRQRAINEQLLMRVAGTALPSGMPQAMPMAH
ncbi:hypothetical protein EV122DRAFT_213798 [Schizophyllum commune]|nr:hypothetical protein K525DRAFT_264941 [Schizophyllum commune Loenen D]